MAAKSNVILFAAGSYNPPTHMHLRMFEIARDFLQASGRLQVLGGIISPVHDEYKKESLLEANATHRCSMVNLSLTKNPLIKLSTFEVDQNAWTRLRTVLEEHRRLLMNQSNEYNLPWAPERFNPQESFRILFLCGADLLESFSVPGLWLEEDIEVIVKDFGLVVVSREGSNPQKFIYNSDILTEYRNNIHIVTEWITNDVSSTKVRRAIRRHESVKYLIPDEVIQYISKHGLYGARKK
uniref:Nicotinamide-nucleotide adenylyltransferase n=1 Tax=Caligus clemensi TaxID=344056 RepID=C1C2V0_CALCM|nr:Nicotinamide mononucleotide adenylyltransferase 1 [Caligus clemensi]